MYYEGPRGVADNIKYKFDELFRLTFRTAKTFMVQWLWIKLNCLWFFIILFQTEKKLNIYIYFLFFLFSCLYFFAKKKLLFAISYFILNFCVTSTFINFDFWWKMQIVFFHLFRNLGVVRRNTSIKKKHRKIYIDMN